MKYDLNFDKAPAPLTRLDLDSPVSIRVVSTRSYTYPQMMAMKMKRSLMMEIRRDTQRMVATFKSDLIAKLAKK